MQLQIKIFELVANELHSHLGSFTCTRSLRALKFPDSRQYCRKSEVRTNTQTGAFSFLIMRSAVVDAPANLNSVLPQNLPNGFKGQVRQHTRSRDLAKTLEDPWHEGAHAFVVLWFPWWTSSENFTTLFHARKPLPNVHEGSKGSHAVSILTKTTAPTKRTK